jgi:hypothetical protein
MTGMHRFEDLLPDWRKAYAERVAAAAAVVAKEAATGLPVPVDLGHARRAALSAVVSDAAARFAVDELLPAVLGWLAERQLGPPEAVVHRVRVEAATALRQRLPTFDAQLPLPASRIPFFSWAVAAVGGAVLGCLALTPLSLLLLGQREPGLMVGGPAGAGLTVGLLAWLSQRPKILDALQKVVGAAGVIAALGGVVQVFRQRSFGTLKTAAWIAGAWLVLLTARPRLVAPTRDECQESLRPQVERFLAHAADLVLALCWSHPDRNEAAPVSPKDAAGLPEALADALGVLQAVSDDEAASDKHLRGAVRAVLQRARVEGYEWQTVPAGTPYEAALEDRFECFDSVEVGQAVETLEPALLRRGKLIKPGMLRSL